MQVDQQLLRRIIQPPLVNRRFWVVQALVLLIAALFWSINQRAGLALDGIPSFALICLFVLPTTYAALNFGLAGSLATAAWIILLSLSLVLLNFPPRLYLWAEATQFATLLFVALVVGDRVEREQLARRAREAWILRGSEAERKRIAQELHDEPVQSLVHLCRTIDQPEKLDLTQLRSQATSIAEDLRRIAQNLRPPTLDDLGLAAALRQLTRELEQREVITVNLEIRGETQRLNSELELGLFRIAQEALRNIERHAQTDSAKLRLTFASSAIELQIEDSGRGFKHENSWSPNGALGLIGMRERASLMGGELSITSMPDQGTTVQIVVPRSNIK